MEPKTTKKPSRKLAVFKRELPSYLMLIPGVTFLIIFSYLPTFWNVVGNTLSISIAKIISFACWCR